MGFFNILKTETTCSNCSKPFPVYIQFKFGHTRQLEYQLGDKLYWDEGGKWRTNDVGRPNLPAVNVYGSFGHEICPNCSYLNEAEFDIRMEFDTIISVKSMTDYKNYLDYEEGDGCYYEVND
ncbi:hypothetical protein SAMN05192573_12020 [Mucilaginibacter gossypii]|uniref:Uncharacterized protein n=1 Tax=Mucilaginibacter gossypii TaxID=551996 RepID=A0A1G8K7F7_9SPHI|nr:hypothetical protein SAMN05192573_12020 [Mucilaginibacter gossypii]